MPVGSRLCESLDPNQLRRRMVLLNAQRRPRCRCPANAPHVPQSPSSDGASTFRLGQAATPTTLNLRSSSLTSGEHDVRLISLRNDAKSFVHIQRTGPPCTKRRPISTVASSVVPTRNRLHHTLRDVEAANPFTRPVPPGLPLPVLLDPRCRRPLSRPDSHRGRICSLLHPAAPIPPPTRSP